MSSLVGETRPRRPIALCRQCRRETLPSLKLPSWHRDTHRAAASGMVTTPDPKAERKRRAKARRQEKRATKQLVRLVAAATATLPSPSVVRRLLTTAGYRAVERSEDCERCQAMQERLQARQAGRPAA
jgi:hypothetical protein